MYYSICDVAPGHISQIEQLERQCFSCPWTEEQLRSQLKDPQHEFIAAVDAGGNVLGYVGLMYVLDEGYISHVAVAPDARRQGIGGRLIEELAVRAKSLGLTFMTLEVRAGNTPAVCLYSGHGFTPVGRRKNYYDCPREDAVLMTCYLK